MKQDDYEAKLAKASPKTLKMLYGMAVNFAAIAYQGWINTADPRHVDGFCKDLQRAADVACRLKEITRREAIWNALQDCNAHLNSRHYRSFWGTTKKPKGNKVHALVDLLEQGADHDALKAALQSLSDPAND